jgi:hypothetical protein
VRAKRFIARAIAGFFAVAFAGVLVAGTVADPLGGIAIIVGLALAGLVALTVAWWDA